MRTKRNNHEGNIRERKDGRWEIRITGGIDFSTGKKKRISKCVKTKAEAVEELQKSVYDIRVNGYKDPTIITLNEWYNFWLETYMSNSLKRSTYVSYEGYIRNHYGPAIGTVKLKNLTGVLLQDFYNFKVDEGLSPKTIRNMNLALHKCLDYAKKEGLVLNNATEMINLPRADDKEIQVFSVEQQKKLMKLSYHHRYGIFIRLTLCTGLRLGELLGLSWSEVDLQGSSIKIIKTLNRLATKDKTSENKTEIVLDTPKSKNSKRIIPLPPSAVNELKQWKQTQKNDAIITGSAYEDTGFVVTNELGKYIEPRTMKDHYDRMLKELNCGHFTFHALRHTFATRALEQGMDSKTLSMILGHFSVSFTLDTYAHCLDEHKRKGMALMENIYYAPTDMAEDILSYPLIFTPIADGFILLCKDFPKLNQKCSSIEQGLEQAKIKLKQLIKQYKYPPAPTKTEDLGIPIGSFMVMLAA